MRILVVEDEHKIANSIKRGFEQETWATDVAYDGESGFDLASSESYDVIVLDLMLPKIDGYKVSRILKFDEKYKDIPIIMLTAKAQEHDKDLGLQVGASAYIVKPFDSKDLVEKVRELTSDSVE